MRRNILRFLLQSLYCLFTSQLRIWADMIYVQIFTKPGHSIQNPLYRSTPTVFSLLLLGPGEAGGGPAWRGVQPCNRAGKRVAQCPGPRADGPCNGVFFAVGKLIEMWRKIMLTGSGEIEEHYVDEDKAEPMWKFENRDEYCTFVASRR